MKNLLTVINGVTPLWWKLVLLFDVLIFVVAFFLPPIGEVDPSVIQGIAEISGFAVFGMIPYYIKEGKKVVVRHGSTEVSVGDSVDSSINNIE